MSYRLDKFAIIENVQKNHSYCVLALSGYVRRACDPSAVVRFTDLLCIWGVWLPQGCGGGRVC